MSTVLIYAMLNSPAALSSINTSAFARDAVNARCSQSYGFFEGWQVAGYLPVGKGDTFVIMFGQHSAEAAKMHVLTFGAVPRYFEICLAGALSVTVISGSC